MKKSPGSNRFQEVGAAAAATLVMTAVDIAAADEIPPPLHATSAPDALVQPVADVATASEVRSFAQLSQALDDPDLSPAELSVIVSALALAVTENAKEVDSAVKESDELVERGETLVAAAQALQPKVDAHSTVVDAADRAVLDWSERLDDASEEYYEGFFPEGTEK